MIGFLRFIGVMNAAVWFGSAVFFTLAATSTFLWTSVFEQHETIRVLQWSRSGWVLVVLWSKYYDVQIVCAGIALLHMVAECVYLGRPLAKFQLYILVGLLCSLLLGAFVLQPKIEKYHWERYSRESTEQQVETARRAYPVWDGVTQFLNYLTLAGVMVYLWQVTGLNPQNRFGTKFRS